MKPISTDTTLWWNTSSHPFCSPVTPHPHLSGRPPTKRCLRFIVMVVIIIVATNDGGLKNNQNDQTIHQKNRPTTTETHIHTYPFHCLLECIQRY